MRLCRRAFSFPELALVLLLLAVQVAVLYPMLEKAKEAGRSATCQSNLRACAVALHMYWNDWDDGLPSSAVAAGDVTASVVPWLAVVHQSDPPTKLGERVVRKLFNPGNPAGRNAPIPWRESFVILDLDKRGWPYSDYQNARYAKRVRGRYSGAPPPLPAKLALTLGTRLSFYGQGDTAQEDTAAATSAALTSRYADYHPPQDSRTEPLCSGFTDYATWVHTHSSLGVWFDPPNLVLLPVAVVRQDEITPSAGGLILSGYMGFFIESYDPTANTVVGYFVSPMTGNGTPSDAQVVSFLTSADRWPGKSSARPSSWAHFLTHYLRDRRAVFCPSDNPRTRLSYWYKYAADLAWRDPAILARKEGDFAFPSQQVLLYEHSGWHTGDASGIRNGVSLNVVFFDGHSAVISVRNSQATYPTRSEEAEGTAAVRPGAPMYYNYDTQSGTYHPGVADYVDPRRYRDAY